MSKGTKDKVKVDLVCQFCAKPFTRDKSAHKTNLAKGRNPYCSIACANRDKQTSSNSVQAICPRCGTTFLRRGKTNPKKWCSASCRYNDWVDANRERNNANIRKYRARRYKEEGCWRDSGPKAAASKSWMVELKSKPCHDCGNTFDTCCMDFDHRTGTTKAYNLGSMFAHHYSKELIQTELDKCDLVCSNCHRIRTRDRRTGSGKVHLKYE